MDHGEPRKKRKYGELAAHDDKALLNAMSSYVEMRQRVYRAEVASSTLVAKNHQLEKQAIEQEHTIRDQQQKIENVEKGKNLVEKVTDENLKLVEKGKNLVIQINSLTATNQSYTLQLEEKEKEMENKDLMISQKQKEIEQLVSLPKKLEELEKTLSDKDFQLREALAQVEAIKSQQQKIEIGAELYKKIIQEQKDNLEKVTDKNLELVEKSKDLVIQLTSLTAANQSYTLRLRERENEMENKDLVIAQKQKEIEQLLPLPKILEELGKTLSDKDFQLKEALAQVEAIKSQHQTIENGVEQDKKLIQEQKDNLHKVTDENLKLVEKGKNLVMQINSLTATNQSYTLQLKEKEKENENKDLVIAQKRKEIMEQLLPLWKNLHKIEKKNSDKDFQLKEALAQVEAMKSQQQNIAEPYKKIIQKQKHDFQKVTDENLKLVEKCKDLDIQLNSLADTNQSYVFAINLLSSKVIGFANMCEGCTCKR